MVMMVGSTNFLNLLFIKELLQIKLNFLTTPFIRVPYEFRVVKQSYTKISTTFDKYKFESNL